VEVTRTYTPDKAAGVQSEKFVPVAVVRGADRIALPAGARVEDGRIAMPRMYVHKLAPGDVIQQDEIGRIVAVRSGGNPPVVTRFVPGTAESPATSDEVRGELADDAAQVPLKPGDSIEMHGNLTPDDRLAGGDHVESKRATGPLIAGVVLFVLSYGPTLYVGAESSLPSDRVLEAPVVGPWIDLAGRPKCVPPMLPITPPIDPCTPETAARVGLVVSGSAQALATVLTLVGLPTHPEVVEGPPQEGAVGARSRPRLVFVPTLGGLAAMGTF
jgi:hypothetical protein